MRERGADALGYARVVSCVWGRWMELEGSMGDAVVREMKWSHVAGRGWVDGWMDVRRADECGWTGRAVWSGRDEGKVEVAMREVARGDGRRRHVAEDYASRGRRGRRE